MPRELLSRGLLSKNPALIFSFLNVAASPLAVVSGHSPLAVLFLLTAASFLGLHTKIITKTVATETAIKAANDAATTTAANLTVKTVGGLGEVTEAASKVAQDAVGLVTGLLEARNPISRILAK